MSFILTFFLIVTGVLLVGAALLWVQVYRAPENTPVRLFAVMISLMAANFTLNVFQGVDPAVQIITVNLLAVATGFFKVSLLLSLLYGRAAVPRILRELAIASVVAAVATVCWLLAPPDLRAVLPYAASGDRPQGFIFSLSIIGYLVYVSVRTILWVRRLMPQVRRVVLRVSLYSIGAGAAAHIISGSANLYSIIALYFPAIPEIQTAQLYSILPIFTSIAFAALLIGVLVPIIDGVVREIPRMRDQHAAISAMGPLWRALLNEFPGIALERRAPRPGRELYRRTVEIRDGLLLLSPYFSQSVADQAASSAADRPPDEQRLIIQAALVKDALQAHRAERLPAAQYSDLVAKTEDDDWATDAGALVLLAQRFAEIELPSASY